METEPYLAVDPTNTNHLVGAWIQDAQRGIVAAVSFNGGDTWRSVVIPGISLCSGGIYAYAADPWVSFAPNGDVYISSIENPGTDKRAKAVLVNKSSDGGLTWSGPTNIVVGTGDYVDKESITADPTNPQYVYATWTRFSSSLNKGTTMFARTTDGGQTWEPGREIFDSASRNVERGQQIVVLPDGTLVDFFTQLLFKNYSGGVEHYELTLSLIRSSDRGQTWLPADKPIAVADMLALGDTYGIPGIGGVPNPDGGLGTTAPGFVFDVAIDASSGKLYAVWQDARFSNFQYTSIAFSMSTDGGFTWSRPIKINQTPDNISVGNQQAFLPSVAVNQDGVVAVTYYDFRNNTPDPGLPTDVWMVHAHPKDGLTNPASWSSENRLTATSFEDEVPAAGPDGYFMGDYQGLVAAGKNFGAFWAMPPNGGGLNDQDSVFFRDPLPTDGAATVSIITWTSVMQTQRATPSVDPSLLLLSTVAPAPVMATNGTPVSFSAAQGANGMGPSAVVAQASATSPLLDVPDRVLASAAWVPADSAPWDMTPAIPEAVFRPRS